MAIHDLKEQINRLPHQPGVYLYSNAAGESLYVGKARSLRDRVRRSSAVLVLRTRSGVTPQSSARSQP